MALRLRHELTASLMEGPRKSTFEPSLSLHHARVEVLANDKKSIKLSSALMSHIRYVKEHFTFWRICRCKEFAGIHPEMQGTSMIPMISCVLLSISLNKTGLSDRSALDRCPCGLPRRGSSSSPSLACVPRAAEMAKMAPAKLFSFWDEV